jgi:hypothetical protein
LPDHGFNLVLCQQGLQFLCGSRQLAHIHLVHPAELDRQDQGCQDHPSRINKQYIQRVRVVPDAIYLFEAPGALDSVIEAAICWFQLHPEGARHE